ncbi:hypothetical protein AHAS_Ahas17G0091300 [Arachis hypogaea]
MEVTVGKRAGIFQRRRWLLSPFLALPAAPSDVGASFSALPYDVMAKIAASVGGVPVVVGGITATEGGNDAALIGEEVQARKPQGKQNVEKALESFEKAASRGFSLAMVDAGRMYWGEEKSKDPLICS